MHSELYLHQINVNRKKEETTFGCYLMIGWNTQFRAQPITAVSYLLHNIIRASPSEELSDFEYKTKYKRNFVRLIVLYKLQSFCEKWSGNPAKSKDIAIVFDHYVKVC